MKQARLAFGGKPMTPAEIVPEKRASQVINLDVEETKLPNLPSATEGDSQPGYVFVPRNIQPYTRNTKPKELSHGSYDPILDAPFYYGESVPFNFLATALGMVSECQGKGSKTIQTEIMCNVFRTVICLKPDELVKVFYLSIGKFFPDHKGLELGIGDGLLNKAVAKATGMSDKQVKQQLTAIGDLGTVASKNKQKQSGMNMFIKRAKTEPHALTHVYNTFIKIANTSGGSSVNIREGLLLSLMLNASGEECKFIIRFAQKSLKIGASELTMQVALARAIAMTPPQQDSFPPNILKSRDFESQEKGLEELLKKAINQCPDYDIIFSILMQYGPAGKPINYLSEMCRIQTGTPIKPMLAKPTKGINEILQRFNNTDFTCEYKYDGMRAQIHINSPGDVQLFSRNSENLTPMYPDLVELMSTQYTHIQNCILDSEVVAVDIETGKIRAFQEIMHRSRKNVEKIEVNVCIYAFDILYLNGESLLDLSLDERRKVLFKNFQEIPTKFAYVQYQDVNSFEDVEALLYESIKVGCEGLMVKSLHTKANYEPNSRTFNWLKLKKDYMDDTSLGDSVDVVPIGAFFGTGKRTGVYGSYVLAIYNQDTAQFQSITKIGTGFSDEALADLHAKLSGHVLPNKRGDYNCKLDMDVWFDPVMVWEIKAADLSISPTHMAAEGIVDPAKGIALRFPRFLRIREDKKPEESTSAQQIVEMYMNQSTITNTDMNFDDLC